MEATKEQSEPTVSHLTKRASRSWGGLVFLIAVSLLVLYGIYAFQIKPLLSMRLPRHEPLAPDAPPVELTSFQVREGGKDLTPQCIAINGDSIYVSFADDPVVLIYSTNLARLGALHLDKPSQVIPHAIAVTDSQLIVTDTTKGIVAVFDHEGDYISSAAWYPGKQLRILPIQLSTNGKLLTVIDAKAGQVAVISLIVEQPFYDFLELMNLIPKDDRSRLPKPTAAAIAPEGSFWIGDSTGKALIYSPTGDYVNEIEQPTRTKITMPIAFAAARNSSSAGASIGAAGHWQPDQMRMHLLDGATGKVYVYDLTGRLKLVYPQDRVLQQPTSIAINSTRREIFITERNNRSITVFGY